MFIPDVQDGPVDEAVLTPHRFHGNSSGFTLLQKVIGMKRESTEGGESNKNHFMSYPDPVHYEYCCLPTHAHAFLCSGKNA